MTDLYNSPSSPIKDLVNPETEKQLWEILRLVPGVNVAYGSVRCLVYIIKNDEKESLASAVDVAKGVVQTAAITAGVFAVPVTIPVAFGGLTGIAAKSVSETIEVVIFFLTNAELLEGKPPEEKEKILYDKIRRVPLVGALYSAVRIPIYIFSKNNKERCTGSTVNFFANSGETAVKIGVSMIPNLDAQLKNIITQTVQHVIMDLEAKVTSKVSKQNLALKDNPRTIRKVETNDESLLEIQSTSMNSTIAPTSNNDENVHKIGSSKKWYTIICCCCITSKTI